MMDRLRRPLRPCGRPCNQKTVAPVATVAPVQQPIENICIEGEIVCQVQVGGDWKWLVIPASAGAKLCNERPDA